MCQYLSDNVRRTMTHAIEKEEKISLEYVTNLDEVVTEIQDKFTALKVRFHPMYVSLLFRCI